MAAAWKGFLAFGLVSIPISLEPAARSERISFNQIHLPCGSRIKQPTYCPTCEKFVDRSEVVKGYEHEKGQYLLFTKEELEEIEPESARTMEILSFVKSEEIDPVYFESSYYAKPDESGVRAYDLLLDAMRKTGYAAIAKVTMFGRENIVIIRALESGFTLHTMFYENEVRAAGEKPKKSELKDAESKLAMQLIDTLAAPFEPSEYVDTYRQELERLIEAKRSGKKLAVMPRVKRENVVDLMSALKTSLSRESSKRDLLRTVAKPNKEQKKSRAS